MTKKKVEKDGKGEKSTLVRIKIEVLERVALAASLMKISQCDYVSRVLEVATDRDIKREAEKLCEAEKNRSFSKVV